LAKFSQECVLMQTFAFSWSRACQHYHTTGSQVFTRNILWLPGPL